MTTQLLEMGIDSTWNDNNEYEVWDGEARCYGFGREIAIKHIRPVMPLLMMRASLEAQQRALLGFQRGAHHQQRHHRANMFDGDFTAKAVAAGFAVPYFVFVIIVPGRIDAHLQ